ncbi:arginase family protein [Blautia schinkii]|nr:arginase family protein [Blautia schinkii]
MQKIESNRIVVMDFTGIYDREQFYHGQDAAWVEVREIPGTNCYCDAEAADILRARIAEFPARGIHFIDSGNYHYMSRIWLEKIEEPFRLLVFDNHTDMQPPAFGGLLSCGGWIAAAMEELDNLREVVLVGPDEEAYSQAATALKTEDESASVAEKVLKHRTIRKKRVCFLSREALAAESREELEEFFEGLGTELPLYISLDKDVLCRSHAHTAWSQGDMTLEELTGYLHIVAQKLMRDGGTLLGVDICGECDPQESGSWAVNDKANRVLLEFFSDIYARCDADGGKE